MAKIQTCGEALVRLLHRRGVDTVFGIPGVHTLELYRGLAGNAIRHVLVRHEQGAGFMADGYARISGRPGVCFVITGPGLTNIATAMGQAYSESVPMLVISTVRATAHQIALTLEPDAPLFGSGENPAYAVVLVSDEAVVIHDHSYLEEDNIFPYDRGFPETPGDNIPPLSGKFGDDPD